MKVDEPRSREAQRREQAQQHRGEVVEGSGKQVVGRSMDQMVSVRLEPDVVAQLRSLATEGSTTLSEVIRAAVAKYITSAHMREATVEILIESKVSGLLSTGLANVESALARSVTGSGLLLRDVFGAPLESSAPEPYENVAGR